MSSLFDTKSGRRRSRYFRQKGLENPPSSQEERFSLAQKFFDEGDNETAFMLFDRIMDYDHPAFLNLAGQIHASDASPVYDLEAAEKNFRRAFKYVDEEQQKKLRLDIASNLIATHANCNNINLSNIHNLFTNPYVADATLELIDAGQRPDLFKFGTNIDRSLYFTATAYASGHLDEPDHDKAMKLYEEYFDEQDEGYLSKLYQNTAIRTALGIGREPNHRLAQNIMRTARVLLQNSDQHFDPVFTSTFNRFIKATSSETNRKTLSAISTQLKRGLHPYGFIPVATEDGLNSIVLSDAAFLISFLAHAENWKDLRHWPQIAQGIAEQTSNIEQARFDFIESKRLNDISSFHPQVLDNGEKELVLRDKRLKVHEHFKRQNFGIPPLDPEERRVLAAQFFIKTPPDFRTAKILFDAEVDSKNPDWLLLMGHINKKQGNRKQDNRRTWEQKTGERANRKTEIKNENADTK